jgi:hypothetical protein
MNQLLISLLGALVVIVILLLLRMDETVYGTKGYLSIIRWIDPSINIDSYIIQRTENGGTAHPGDIMTNAGETQGIVDVAEATDTGFLGIMLNETTITADYDIDEIAGTGVTIDILRPTGGRTICAVTLDSEAGPVAWEEGDWCRVGAAGKVASWVYNDTDSHLDSFEVVIGKAAEVLAGHTANDEVIHIWY